MAMDNIQSPALIDYMDGDEVDAFKFTMDTENYKTWKRAFDDEANGAKRQKKPFQKRKKDVRTSNWWLDYVVDANHTWRDPDHRDGKLFRNRFFLSFVSIHELVEEIKKPGNYFWSAPVSPPHS